MNHLERFIRYAVIDTVSADGRGEVPSTAGQWDLANLLVEELLEMGLSDAHVNEYGTVYAHIPATPGFEDRPAIGFIAHMDTVPGGKGVKPHVIENYDGGDVTLECGTLLQVKDHPHLPSLKGRTLIVSGGDTILGADDKAGIVAIMELVDLLQKKDTPHGPISIGFTPDEEIGEGVLKFDVEEFHADYAFTIDGGDEADIEAENFNAATVFLNAKGFMTHTGSAKGLMKNAIAALAELHSMLPAGETPEDTEGKEGFFYLAEMHGDVNSASSRYLIRDFDPEGFEKRKQLIHQLAYKVNARWGAEIIQVQIVDSYRNMAQVIDQHPQIRQSMEEALTRCGLTPHYLPIRGGTDGARLCYMGLPCPNLGAGGYAFHSFTEHCTLEGMEKSTEILMELVKIYAESKK